MNSSRTYPADSAKGARQSILRGMWAPIVLALIAFAMYQPGLKRVFVMDQIWYFAELDGDTSLGAGLAHYDYHATRQYWKGDDALFRPLLFTWLAIGNALFSYHHVWWNIATLGIHALVAFFLFRLLRAIRPSPFALPLAALFLVMKPPLELPLWNHLGGYLLGCLFLTIALRAFVRLTNNDGGTPAAPRESTVYALAFTGAVFCHEAMVPVCFLAGVIAAVVEWRRRGFLTAQMALKLAFPVLLFVVLYAFHVFRVQRIFYVDRPDVQGILDPANLKAILPRSIDTLTLWTKEVALPSSLSFGGAPFGRLEKRFMFSWQSPIHLWNAALFATTLALLAWSLSRKHLARASPTIALMGGAILAYVGVICLGRPQSEVFAITYYLYFFCLASMTLVYSLVDFDRVRGPLVLAAWIVIAATIILHATETRPEVVKIGRMNERASSYFETVSRFVDQHKGEAGFTFAIQDRPPDVDPSIALVEGYPDKPTAVRMRRLTEVLFVRYYDAQKPRYVIDSNGMILEQPKPVSSPPPPG